MQLTHFTNHKFDDVGVTYVKQITQLLHYLKQNNLQVLGQILKWMYVLGGNLIAEEVA